MGKTGKHSTFALVALQTAFLALSATATTPINIRIPQIGGQSARVAWQNDEPAVTNVVYLRKLVHIPESGTTVDELTFDEFSNVSNRQEKTSAIIAEYPQLAGSQLLYLPPDSTGQIQMSNSSKTGALIYSSSEDYSDLWLEMSLKRYNAGGENENMVVAYFSESGPTNEIASVPLGVNLERRIVPLTQVPYGCKIIFLKGHTPKPDRQGQNRVIIDEMRFIRDYVAAHTETNLVDAIAVVGKSSVKLKDLDRETDYIVSVSAVDSYGVESEPSPPTAFTTTSELEIGLAVRLR